MLRAEGLPGVAITAANSAPSALAQASRCCNRACWIPRPRKPGAVAPPLSQARPLRDPHPPYRTHLALPAGDQAVGLWGEPEPGKEAVIAGIGQVPSPERGLLPSGGEEGGFEVQLGWQIGARQSVQAVQVKVDKAVGLVSLLA